MWNKHISYIQAITACALACCSSAALAGQNLFFSEYVEGSSNNKALEIYNATGASVDLSEYRVEFYFNGSASAGLTIDLAGTVAAGEVFVLAQEAANSAILAAADQTAGGGWFNGDDAVVLASGAAVLDVIGQIGFDPGSEWGDATIGTQNATLRRQETVTAGDPDGSDDFAPELLAEWVAFPQDTSDGLGFYSGTGGGPTARTIPEIQGAGHISPVDGQSVITSGIVTAVDFAGFYLQDPVGDGDTDTSDGLFIFTGTPAAVSAGDEVEVTGTVVEFTPGGTGTGNLSITEITGPQITVLSTGNPLPAPAVIGSAGRTPPTEIIDNDQFAVFDPDEDGIDFYETYEGMLVTVAGALAVSPTNRFGEIYTVTDGGTLASGLNTRGGITIAEDDYNPERVQVDFDFDLLPGFEPAVTVGDTLGDVTGVVTYSFGNTEIAVTELFTPVSGGLAPEATALSSGPGQLTMASYNVLNLDPVIEDPALGESDDDVGDGRFAAIGAQIAGALAAPDVIGLQEIQDNDGGENTGVVDASLTLQTLVDAIADAGGPAYAFAEIPPVNLADGGQPGANIRNTYLYRPDRVTLVPGSLQRLIDPDLGNGDAFADSRKPLVAQFDFEGDVYTVINVHFSSKGGSSPLFGTVQPPVNGRVANREAQAQVVNDYVDQLLAGDADANIVVLGDLNEFSFNSPLEILTGGATPVLTNLTLSLDAAEQYTFIFEGNSQALDHVLVSASLAAVASYDIVHVNVEFPVQASDHEPMVVRFDSAQADSDSDGVPDTADNCQLAANADQRDTDGDGIGNLCDGDFNGDCNQNFLDLGQMKGNFFMFGDLDTDMNGDGSTNFLDLGLLKGGFFMPPGPSGVPNACSER